MPRTALQFSLLGPMETRVAGRPVWAGPVKPRIMLAALLLNADRVVTIESISDAIWSGDPPRSAVPNIRTYAHRLRTVLGDTDRIRGESGGYAIRIAPRELDVSVFNALLDDAECLAGKADAESTLALLRRALAIWRGHPLEDLPSRPIWDTAISELNERRLAATEWRFSLELRTGAFAHSIVPLRKLIKTHPFRERLWRNLIIALYGSGHRREALDAFQDMRRLFVDELGVEPGEEIQRTHAAVLSGLRIMPMMTGAVPEIFADGRSGEPAMTLGELVEAGVIEPAAPDFRGRPRYRVRRTGSVSGP